MIPSDLPRRSHRRCSGMILVAIGTLSTIRSSSALPLTPRPVLLASTRRRIPEAQTNEVLEQDGDDGVVIETDGRDDRVKSRRRHGGVNPFRFLLRGLWKGVTLPFPSLRKLIDKTSATPSSSGVRDSVAALSAYLTTGVVSYKCVLEPTWSVVDCLYFTVTSFTTVGYGDLCPSNIPSKAFTCVFGLTGIAFLGAVVSTLSHSIVESQAARIKQAREISRKRYKALFENMPEVLETFKHKSIGEKEHHFENARKQEKLASVDSESSPASGAWRRAIVATVPALFVVVAGGTAVHRLNGNPIGAKNWFDFIYYSIITASTIGLGDISPLTRPARIAAIIYIPFAVATAGELLAGAASAFLEQRHEKQLQEEQVLTITQLTEMDADGSGRVSRAEYIKFMLHEMGIVEADELKELDEQFDRLDKSRSGYLDKEDLALMAKYRGVDVS